MLSCTFLQAFIDIHALVVMTQCKHANPAQCFVNANNPKDNFYIYKVWGLWLTFLCYLLPSVGYIIFYRPRDILRRFNRYPEEFHRVSIV